MPSWAIISRVIEVRRVQNALISECSGITRIPRFLDISPLEISNSQIPISMISL